MTFKVTIEKLDGLAADPEQKVCAYSKTEVYSQTFDDLNLAHVIQVLNHKPRKRREAKGKL